MNSTLQHPSILIRTLLCLCLETACEPSVERIVVDGTLNNQDPNQDPNRLPDPNTPLPIDIRQSPQVGCSPCDTNQTRPSWLWNPLGKSSRYRVRLMDDNFEDSMIQLAEPSFTIPLDVPEGQYTLYVSEWLIEHQDWSGTGQATVHVDRTKPLPPIDLTVRSPNPANRPTWNWSASEPEIKSFRVKINSSQLTVGGTLLQEDSYQAPTELPDGLHVLYLQQQDKAGNWSEVISRSVLVDTVGPSRPVVTSETGDPNTISRFPSWIWYSGSSDGAKIFEYELLNHLGNVVYQGMTRALKWRSPNPLAPGNYTLQVRERDVAGNWSLKGSFLIEVLPLTPYKPTVLVSSYYQSSLQPVWTWIPYNNSQDGSFITELYQIQSNGTQVLYPVGNQSMAALTFQPASALAANYIYRLYVQEIFDPNQTVLEQDESGYQDVLIDTIAPEKPLNNGTPGFVNNTIPTWYWRQSGDSISDPANAFRVTLDPDPNNPNPQWTIVHDTFFIHSPAPPYIHLSQGLHRLWVQQQDLAGNWSASLVLELTIDTVAPASPNVLVDAVAGFWRWYPAVGEEIARYRYSFNTPNLNNPDGEVPAQDENTLALPAVATTLYVYAQDRAGNWSSFGVANFSP